jgi:hypothetical protein
MLAIWYSNEQGQIFANKQANDGPISAWLLGIHFVGFESYRFNLRTKFYLYPSNMQAI